MGAYSDRIAREHERARLTDAQIRANKCQRSKERNNRRKAEQAEKNAVLAENRASRSWAEQWAVLDARLGVNQGAARERERLAWESLNG